MKYKLQVEKLKQITLKKMDGNLAMANQQESQDEGYTPFEMDLLNQITELKNKQYEIARGFALWLLCNYDTSEEGMSLCWINVETKTKHYTNEVFEIYLKGLE